MSLSGAPSRDWLELARHRPLAILTDLDGTLIPFAAKPDEARPQRDIVDLLGELAASPGVAIAVVSGRPKGDLEDFFGSVAGLGLAAEHGGWLRARGNWEALVPPESNALDSLAVDLETLAAPYRSARVQRKTWSVCLHTRGVAHWAKVGLLAEAVAVFDAWGAAGYELLEGAETLEIRLAGVRKAAAVSWIREIAGPGARILALGDDLTDEDMFRELGSLDKGILVGESTLRETAAGFSLRGPTEAIGFLRWVLCARHDGKAPPPIRPQPIGSPAVVVAATR